VSVIRRLRWLAHAGIWALCLILAQSQGVRADSAEAFLASCIPNLPENTPGLDHRRKICNCMATEIRKKFGDKAFSSDFQPANLEAETLSLGAICAGRYVQEHFESVSARECDSDAACREANSCMAREMKAIGSEAEIGAILTAIMQKRKNGGGDGAKLARYDQVRETCGAR
jgi:hypothetical protein